MYIVELYIGPDCDIEIDRKLLNNFKLSLIRRL